MLVNEALNVIGRPVSTQQEYCAKVESEFVACGDSEKLGIALETLGKLPVNGMRIKPENGTCGWYIWCGENFSEDADFFKPLHVAHLPNYLPQVEKFLGLSPGHRFLVAGEYEDVWYDQALIDI